MSVPVGTILEKALEILNRDGWTDDPGELNSVRGPRCAVLAISSACRELALPVGSNGVVLTLEVFRNHLGFLDKGRSAVAMWNDTHSEEQVKLAFKQLIAKED